MSWHLAGHEKFSMNRRLKSVFVILRLYNKFQSSTVLGTDQFLEAGASLEAGQSVTQSVSQVEILRN